MPECIEQLEGVIVAEKPGGHPGNYRLISTAEQLIFQVTVENMTDAM
jgi:hypothetical protein